MLAARGALVSQHTAVSLTPTSTMQFTSLRSPSHRFGAQFARFACAGFALAGLSSALPAQTLVTDKDDYAPGETVYLQGSDFQPGETIGITLRVETPNDSVIDYAIGGIVVYGDGSFTGAWLVPQEALDSNITATAMGSLSGRLAIAQFTDSHGVFNVRFATSGLPAGNPITVSGSRINPGHNDAAFSVSLLSPGPSADIGAQAGGSLFYYSGFPSSVASAGGDYLLVDATPSSGFETGANKASVTVTASYSFVPDVVCPV